MMAYIDKQILDLRELQKKQKYSSLDTGFYIDNELIEFDRVSLFQNAFSIILPKTFVTMPLNIMKSKYQSNFRPQLVKTSLDTTVNFYFGLYDVKLVDNQVCNVIQQAHDALKKVNPAFIFYDMKFEDREKNKIGWFDYKSYGLDDQMYNVMAVTPIDQKFLHVGFNCHFRMKEEWRPAAIQVILSVWDTTKENRKIV